MYQFSGKLKILSLALIIVGAIGIGFSFFSAPKTIEASKEMIAAQSSHGNTHGTDHAATTNSHGEHHDAAHDEHVFHQLQNKPWSALYVSLIFFLGISLLVLAFYAAQRVAQSGWSVVLFRVMEAITANLVPTSIIMLLVILSASLFHYNHLFSWMAEGIFDPTSEKYDAIVD